MALRKRESEPATPLTTSFKGLPSLLEDPPRDKTRVTVEEAALKLREETQPTSVSVASLRGCLYVESMV